MLGSFCSVHDLSLNIKKYRTMSRNIAQYRAPSPAHVGGPGATAPLRWRNNHPLINTPCANKFSRSLLRQKSCPQIRDSGAQSPVALNLRR